MQRCCSRIAGPDRIACRRNYTSSTLFPTGNSAKRNTFAIASSAKWTPSSTGSCTKWTPSLTGSCTKWTPSLTGSCTKWTPSLTGNSTLIFRRQYARPRQQQKDYAHLISFDKDHSIPESTCRQSRVRQERAWQDDGFGFIDESKLPSRSDADKIESWLPYIDAALPRRLRLDPLDGNQDTYSAQDITRLLSIVGTRYGLDLLTHLAVEKGRWKAVVWLITQVVNHNYKPEPSQPHAVSVWNTRQSTMPTLAEMTQKPVYLDPRPDQNSTVKPAPPSLDQITDELHPLNEPLPAILRHDSLGQVWQSLGYMIVADAARAANAARERIDPSEEAIRPEILQIIALLHHSGAMPSSIYSYQPAEDSSVLRQPPTLHLLSNQIITSLTDAAWKAHETLVVEEAKEKGGVYASLRPEIPGSMYKVHVAGLGHEVWLELVLWSCLHGRFFVQGASILELVAKQKSPAKWSVLSWRELASPLIQAGQEKSINWDEVKFMFNTGVSKSKHDINKKKVRRTVSSEVIAAFVDGLLSDIRRGVGARGISPFNILRYLTAIKNFLELDRNNMSLGFTSWDAVVLRFIDSQGIDIDQDPDIARRVVDLSSRFGDEISTVNAPIRNELWHSTPTYVLDGTAANLGLMHRVLRAHVRLGNLRGAIPIFQALQKMTDLNKQRSIQEFFAKQKEAADKPNVNNNNNSIDFEDRFSGIEYPSFFPQIPITILAPFLDLIIDAKDVDLGSWLLHSEDVDGPIIPESMYGDSIMGPPLVRLAATAGDKELLAKIFERQRDGRNGSLPHETLTALMEHQIQNQNWQFVERALENLVDLPGYSISTHTLAIAVRMILREAKSMDGDLQRLEQSDSSKMFHKIIGSSTQSKSKLSEIAGQVWRLLACINDEWREYAWKSSPSMQGIARIRLRAQPFNIILEGILDAYGSETGKRFFATFWTKAHGNTGLSNHGQDEFSGGVSRMPVRPGVGGVLTSSFSRSELDTRVIVIHGPEDKQTRLRTKFTPNITTIRLVLQHALREHKGNAELIEQDVKWARQMMRSLGVRERHVRAELDGILGPKAGKVKDFMGSEDQEVHVTLDTEEGDASLATDEKDVLPSADVKDEPEDFVSHRSTS